MDNVTRSGLANGVAAIIYRTVSGIDGSMDREDKAHYKQRGFEGLSSGVRVSVHCCHGNALALYNSRFNI